MKCPTCGRRPSERHDIELPGETVKHCVVTPACLNPIHDLADLGPEMAEWIRMRGEHTDYCDYYRSEEPCNCGLADLLAKVEAKK